MDVDGRVVGEELLCDSVVDVPWDSAFVRYNGSELIFFAGGLPSSEMDSGNVYHIKAADSVRNKDGYFEGCWDGKWKRVNLADPGATYLNNGCRMRM